MSITIKLSNGTQKSVEVPDLSISVATFKEIAFTVTDIPANEQRIVFKGKVLKDADILSTVGMEHGQAVHIVRGQKPAASGMSTAPQPASSVPSAPSTTSTQAIPAVTNPYMALADSTPTPGVGAPGMSPFAMGRPPMGAMSPDVTAQMMQDPMFMQLVQNTMQNPELMRQMMQIELQRMQAGGGGVGGGQPGGFGGMEQFLNNPMIMSQALQMMSDPNLMSQTMGAFSQNPSSAPASGTGSLNTPQNSMPWAGMPQLSAPGTAGMPFQGDPRVIYRSQLQQLREMGFPNEEANIAALQQAQGNIDFAIERLLNA